MLTGKRKRATVRMRLVTIAVCFAVFVVLQLNSASDKTIGQSRETLPSNELALARNLPPDSLIDDFDKVIQERFLTKPFFGIARIAPVRPVMTNPHFRDFYAFGEAEVATVQAFESSGWDVGIYLFGRKVIPRTGTQDPNKFDIKYRLFDPIRVTNKEKDPDFRDSKSIADPIKQAFVEFQKTGSPNENEVRFDVGRWSYVARPVRAANQSCVECHKDNPVVLDRLGDGKFTIRPRRVGDANGVLVYAFARHEK